MRSVLQSLVVLLLLFSAEVAQGSEETRRYFSDLLGACRTNGYCSATAYDRPGYQQAVAAHVLRVGRHAEGLYWEVSLSTVIPMARERSDFFIDIDGEYFSFTVPDTAGAYSSINDFFFLGDDAQNLIDAMVAGQTMTIEFTDETGERATASFSLSGLAATLLWIDEQQSRLGSERIAYGPPIGLDPVGAKAVNVPENLLRTHMNNPACGPFDHIDALRDVIRAEVSEDATIWFLSCYSGAYNFAHAAYLDYGYEEYDPLYFAEYSERYGWSGTPYLVNMSWDPATKRLTTFNKGRGIADCGTSGVWKWDEYAFRLIEFYAKDDCDAQGDPGDFPLVYKAKPRTAN